MSERLDAEAVRSLQLPTVIRMAAVAFDMLQIIPRDQRRRHQTQMKRGDLLTDMPLPISSMSVRSSDRAGERGGRSCFEDRAPDFRCRSSMQSNG